MLLSMPLCLAFTDQLTDRSGEMVKTEFYGLRIMSSTNATKQKYNREMF